MRRTIAAVTAAAFLAGCATSSQNIAAQSVSPLQYQGYDCEQIAAELTRLHNRATELGAQLDTAASNDAALTTVGIVLFWPALFFLGGKKAQEAEYARVKGEHEALQSAYTARKCYIQKVPA